MIKKIDVLGTKYKIIFADEKTNNELIDSNGYVDIIKKEIVLDKTNKRLRKTIIHELVHAFFYESGIEKYFNDELLVNWISLQFDKILNVVEQVNEPNFDNPKG